MELSKIELNVVDHCNLSCRDCSHCAPIQSPSHLSLKSIEEDLRIIFKYTPCSFIRILGGEPFLHPDLLGVLRLIRRLRSSVTISVITNGTIPVSKEIWGEIDVLNVSIYPPLFAQLTPLLQQLRRNASFHHKSLHLLDRTTFMIPFIFSGQSEEEAAKIHSSCKIVSDWGCTTIYKGRFYKCSHSIYIPRVLSLPFEDSIPLQDDPSFPSSLSSFLLKQPTSCLYCLGTSGQNRPHKLVSRDSWLSNHLPSPLNFSS